MEEEAVAQFVVEIVDGGVELLPVDEIERGIDRVARGKVDLQVGENEGRHNQGHDDHEEGRWQQPSRPARPEIDEVDAAFAVELGEQERRDQIARDDKEDVDADKAAADAGEPGVEQHHRADRDRAQPVHVGSVARGRPYARVLLHASPRMRQADIRGGPCAPSSRGGKCRLRPEQGPSCRAVAIEKAQFGLVRPWPPASAAWRRRRSGARYSPRRSP